MNFVIYVFGIQPSADKCRGIFSFVFHRSDFATLPFQATECYLSNIIPLTGRCAI